MKLKVFNKSNTNGKAVVPLVSISKTGLMKFNYKAIEKHHLKDGDRLELVQDEERPSDWYFHRTTSEWGFKLRTDKARFLVFNSSAMVKKISESVGFEGSTRCLLGAEWLELEKGEFYLPIITKSAVK